MLFTDFGPFCCVAVDGKDDRIDIESLKRKVALSASRKVQSWLLG